MSELDADSTIPEDQVTPLQNDVPEENVHTFSASELENQRLREELIQCRDYKEKYLRLLAENENIRKRMQKDKQDSINYAKRDLVLDFLQPIDHMESALKFAQQGSDEVRNWVQGFLMILTQFKTLLSNQGVEAFESVGQPFDPSRHEAVDVLYTQEYAPDTVTQEIVKGYTAGDITLRPARVIVAKAPLTQAAESPAEQPQEATET